MRLDSDAIHNSGGVDLSDHEVNYKILLAPLLRSGRLSPAERHEALFAAADDACESVLAHNRAQSLCLSLDERRSQADPQAFLCAAELPVREHGPRPRASSSCRTPRSSPARRSAGGFTRPELAVLLGLAKLHVRGALGGDALLDRPELHAAARVLLPGAPSASAGPRPPSSTGCAARSRRSRSRTG